MRLERQTSSKWSHVLLLASSCPLHEVWYQLVLLLMKQPLLAEGNLKRTKFKKWGNGSRWLKASLTIRGCNAETLSYPTLKRKTISSVAGVLLSVQPLWSESRRWRRDRASRQTHTIRNNAVRWQWRYTIPTGKEHLLHYIEDQWGSDLTEYLDHCGSDLIFFFFCKMAL